jgi:predicted outer membrane protein
MLNEDKLLTIAGAAVTLLGVISSVATGAGYAGLGTTIAGLGLIAKGCGQYLNGDVAGATASLTQGVQDVKAGTQAPATSKAKKIKDVLKNTLFNHFHP